MEESRRVTKYSKWYTQIVLWDCFIYFGLSILYEPVTKLQSDNAYQIV